MGLLKLRTFTLPDEIYCNTSWKTSYPNHDVDLRATRGPSQQSIKPNEKSCNDSIATKRWEISKIFPLF